MDDKKRRRIYPPLATEFLEKVDVEQSNKEFIERMTNKCTYLIEKMSYRKTLLYSKYMVLK